MNAWESIFYQSPANDGYYDEEELPQHVWQWPSETWFQSRLEQVREEEPLVHLLSRKRSGAKAAAQLN